MELTVLGCSGSYGSPEGGACSGYLVQEAGTTVWVDCGNGTFPALQRNVDPAELTAVVLTHEHPDHCVDVYGLHVLLQYGIGRTGLPVYAPAGASRRLGTLVRDWGGVFEWRDLGDGATERVGDLTLRFSRTDHPPPTYAVEARSTATGRRIVYTSDTGPGWSIAAFTPGADLVLSEASYLHAERTSPIHLSAREAGLGAASGCAQRLVLTHLWPRIDRRRAAEEGSDAFGAPVTLAAAGLTVSI